MNAHRVRRMGTAVLLLWTLSGSAVGAQNAPTVSLIPKPLSLEVHAGTYHLTSETRILYDDNLPEVRQLAAYLARWLGNATGYALNMYPVVEPASGPQSIYLTCRPEQTALGDEGYTLEVGNQNIVVAAAQPAGLFRGIQTLRQLLPPESERAAGSGKDGDWSIPTVTIRDMPRYGWRGFMLDVSRTFYSIDVLKQFIDVMALYKLNTLHLHLTDDQGWRVEIKKYPRLTEIGSQFHPKYKEPSEWSGFYTRQQLHDLVAYAQSRYVTIVPEIDMPGHSWPALVAYPELSVSGHPEPAEIFPYSAQQPIFHGHAIDTFDPTKEGVYQFIDDVMSEIVDIFPSPYIHIGGDEVRFSVWENHPHIQQFMVQNQMADFHALQSYFMGRVNDIIRSKGRTMMGWNEITYGGLPNGAAVTAWRGPTWVKKSTALGALTVVGTNNPLYLNFWQNEAKTGMLGDRKLATLQDVYDYRPEAGLTVAEQERILGIQTAMWTHVARHLIDIQVAIFPRFLAGAEQGWTAAGSRDYKDFTERVSHHLPRLDALGIHYWTP